MLYKYLGIDDETKRIRSSFLQDGLFRFTQPKFLDDPQEGIPKFFLHKYSPKDLEVGRTTLMKSPGMFGADIPDELVINLQLTMFPPIRLGEAFPHLLKESGFNSMQDYDEAVLQTISDKFQKQLNSDIGILSLSTDKDNQELWSKYAGDYSGLVVGISDEVKNCPNAISGNVIYDKTLVDLHFSLVDGVVRINGISTKELPNGKLEVNDKFIRSFLFHKKKTWLHQNEFRIIEKLKNCQRVNQDVYLKKIDFKHIRTIIFGDKMNEDEINEILNRAKSNKELEHVKFYKQGFNLLTKEIEFFPLSTE